jgi:hypothetical protein
MLVPLDNFGPDNQSGPSISDLHRSLAGLVS